MKLPAVYTQPKPHHVCGCCESMVEAGGREGGLFVYNDSNLRTRGKGFRLISKVGRTVYRWRLVDKEEQEREGEKTQNGRRIISVLSFPSRQCWYRASSAGIRCPPLLNRCKYMPTPPFCPWQSLCTRVVRCVSVFCAFVPRADARSMKAMLYGENPPLLASLVRFLMECDQAVVMRGDDFLNPLYAHSTVSALAVRVVAVVQCYVFALLGENRRPGWVYREECAQVEARENIAPGTDAHEATKVEVCSP